MTCLLIGEALDPTTRRVGAVGTSAGILVAPEPVTTDPGPDDPDIEWVPPAPAADGITVTVSLYRAVSREHIGDIATAEVSEWDDDVEISQSTSLTIEASTFDPIWEAAALSSFMGSDGLMKYAFDPKGYVAVVHVDGKADKAGMFRQPLDIGGGRYKLTAQGPEALFSERFVGAIEQPDLLNNWGDFETVPIGEEPPGLVKVPDPGHTITAVVVLDAVRGRRCLQVTGRGVVRTPTVLIPGQDGVSRTASFSAFGKWPSQVADGTPVVITSAQRVDSLVPNDRPYSLHQAGLRPSSESGWSKDPAVSGARLSPQVVTHRVWGEMRSFDQASRYDVGTIRQGNLSGFLSNKDLSLYVERLIRDLNRPSMGGSPTGLTCVVDELCDVEIQRTWPHNEHIPAIDALSEICDRDDGPEPYISPNWVVHVVKRRGRWRDDVALSIDQIVDPSWAIDPGAQVDDYIVDTGRGSGTNLVTATVSQPFVESRHRISRLTRAPRTMSLNATQIWADRHAGAAARRQITGEVEVPWWFGQLLSVGDEFWTIFEDGHLGEVLPVRLLRRRKRPGPALHTLTLGMTGVSDG